MTGPEVFHCAAADGPRTLPVGLRPDRRRVANNIVDHRLHAGNVFGEHARGVALILVEGPPSQFDVTAVHADNNVRVQRPWLSPEIIVDAFRDLQIGGRLFLI